MTKDARYVRLRPEVRSELAVPLLINNNVRGVINVDADRAGKPAGTNVAYVRVGPGDAEFFDPTMHEAPLKRIAADTGGRFYTPDTVASLTEDVSYAGRGVTSVEEHDLWNMPIVLLTLMGLVCAEWGYRRAVGLA